jgi:hypothetical protein
MECLQRIRSVRNIFPSSLKIFGTQHRRLYYERLSTGNASAIKLKPSHYFNESGSLSCFLAGYKGLASFSVGGTIILMVFWNLQAHLQYLQSGYSFDFVSGFILQNAIIAIIRFLLVGFGLTLIMKDTKVETLFYEENQKIESVWLELLAVLVEHWR